MASARHYDVIITGAGLAGLTCALALSGNRMSIPLRTLVVDPGPPLPERDHARDTRGSAITLGSRGLLEAIGIWPAIEAVSQPFNDIIVTDARGNTDQAPVLLDFMQNSYANSASAWMLENGTLLDALAGAVLNSPNIDVESGARVDSIQAGSGKVTVSTQTGDTITASLVVAADGRNSPARTGAGIELVRWPYKQSAITLTFNHTIAHRGRAEEHFGRNGPFAILPLTGNRASLVWAESAEEVERLMKLDDAAFTNELQRRIGNHLGEISLASQRTSWPLGLQLAKRFTADRLALIGDAAHVIHPIAGLGFNLGLKDIAALAECIVTQARRGLDIGGQTTLADYESWRRADTLIVAGMCDALARLFSNDVTPLALARQAGLRAVNALPPLKQFFLDSAAGTTGRQPVLMSGGRL